MRAISWRDDRLPYRGLYSV